MLTPIAIDTLEFIRRIVRPTKDDFINFRYIGSQFTKNYITTVDKIDFNAINDQNELYNIYICRNPLIQMANAADQNVKTCRSLFIDFDLIDKKQKHTIKIDEIKAIKSQKLPQIIDDLKSLNLWQFVSCMVDSGGGYHVYMSIHDVDNITPLQKQLYTAINSYSDIKCDPVVSDRCRISRLPGLYNLNYYKPMPVEVIYMADVISHVNCIHSTINARTSIDITDCDSVGISVSANPSLPKIVDWDQLPDTSSTGMYYCFSDKTPCNDNDIKAMIQTKAIAGQHGHDVCFGSLCKILKHCTDGQQFLRLANWYNDVMCVPSFSANELKHKIQDVTKKETLGSKRFEKIQFFQSEDADDLFIESNEFTAKYPNDKPYLIDRLLRRGEIMNVVGSPKIGKSFFILDVIKKLESGQKLFGEFQCHQSKVLIIDKELQCETLSGRIRRKGGFTPGQVFIAARRGKRDDVHSIGRYLEKVFEKFVPDVIIIDALYRVLPVGTDENSNADMVQVYDILTQYAAIKNSAIVVVHHTSKGSQAKKSNTDIGSGAGSISRAPDVHLTLTPHQNDFTLIVRVDLRDGEPVPDFCIHSDYAKDFHMADDANPELVRDPKAKKSKQWNMDNFMAQFVPDEPISKETLIKNCEDAGMSHRQSTQFLQIARTEKKAHTEYHNRVLYVSRDATRVTKEYLRLHV